MMVISMSSMKAIRLNRTNKSAITRILQQCSIDSTASSSSSSSSSSLSSSPSSSSRLENLIISSRPTHSSIVTLDSHSVLNSPVNSAAVFQQRSLSATKCHNRNAANTNRILNHNLHSTTNDNINLIIISRHHQQSIRQFAHFVRQSSVYLASTTEAIPSRKMSIVIQSSDGSDGSKDGSGRNNQSLGSAAEEEERTKALKAAKRSLRRAIDAKLATLTADEVNCQSAKVHQRLFDSADYRSARRIGLYLSLPSGEIHTQQILERAFADGKQVFVPSYDFRTRQMEFYEIKSMAEYEELPVEPKYAIKQPELANSAGRKEALSSGGLDMLLCPGVCFTRDGRRLGHGRGYFDTWLARMSKLTGITRPKLVALGLEQQLVDDLPTHEWDFIMDQVLTPNEH